MPADWVQTTIGALCDQYGGSLQTGPFGSQLHAHDYVHDGRVRVVPTSAIGNRKLIEANTQRIRREKAESLARHYLRTGDIVFARRGVQATGLSALVEPRHEGWLCGTGVIRLRLPKTSVDPCFLSIVLSDSTSRSWIRQHAIGATMPNLNEAILRGLPLRLPPLSDQRAIAHILGTLDDKIELNRRMNETLEEMARAIFKSWFVDFDPVRAKKEGRPPPAMDPTTAALFPDDYEDSELGKIPKGWQVSRLVEVTSLLKRGIQPAYIDAGGILVINQRCIRNGRVDFAQARGHDPARRSVGGRQLEPLDVLVNSTGVGTLGRTAQLPHAIGQLICDSHVTVVRANKEVASPLWLGRYMAYMQPLIEDMGHGSTGQTELSRARLGELPLVVPPREIQERFDVLISPFFRMVHANEGQDLTLAALRDSLLPKLLTGEIRIRDAERAVEATA